MYACISVTFIFLYRYIISGSLPLGASLIRVFFEYDEVRHENSAVFSSLKCVLVSSTLSLRECYSIFL